MKSEIHQRLEQLAFKRTNSFCYSCYQIVPGSNCPSCGTDDFMRELFGVGVEYGTDWVICHILAEELDEVNIDDAFEQFILEVYPEEITVGWMKFDAASMMKEMDSVSWDLAKQEWLDQEIDETIIPVDNGSIHYWINDIENLLDKEGL